MTGARRRSTVVGVALMLLVPAGLACGTETRTLPRQLSGGPVVAAHQGCPRSVTGPPLRSDRPGAEATMVPPRPDRARVCTFYSGAVGRRLAGRLRSSRLLAHDRVERLAATLNGLRPPPPQPHGCFGGAPTTSVLLFDYPGPPPVAVTINVPNTCLLSTNGQRLADGSRVQRRLRRLLR